MILAPIDMMQGYFTYSCCQIHFTLYCHNFPFVATYSLFWIKEFWLKHCLCKKNVFFHV